MEKSELLSVKEASEILGVSSATVKNWIKLGKLKGQRNGAFFLLSQKDVLDKSSELASSTDLRSRRNKSRQSSNFIPKSYISASSPNYKTIKNLILCEDFSKNNIKDILCSYSHGLLKKAGVPQNISKILLKSLKSSSQSDVSYNKKISGLDCNSHTKNYPLVLIPKEDTLGMLYLSLRSMQDKKSTGAYYTPFFVADELIKNVFADIPSKEISGKKILDPACGTGNFLIRLPENVPLSNIYGYDIDSTAIAIARINLAIRYKITSQNELDIIFSNIRSRDFLFDTEKESLAYDHVIGNPPWGYAFKRPQINAIKKLFESFEGKGKPESFTLFVEKALKCSKSLCFVLPETILSSDYHCGIRKYILKMSCIKQLCYLGEAFDKVQCPCITLQLTKGLYISHIKASFYKKQNKGGRTLCLLRSFVVPKSRIDSDNFNILADDSEYAILQKMHEVPHFTLKDNCDFALGIVTGANSTLLSDTYSNGLEPIIKGKDISKYSISVGNTYTAFSPDKYQQVAPISLYRAQDKLFYRFIANEPVVALDRNALLSLNSANIMVPHVNGYSNYYIMAILNSSAMSFYYRHTCKNLKVLRSTLETLPIPICDEVTRKEITKMSKMISDYYANNDQSFDEEIVLKTIKRLDKCVANLYNLNADQVKILSE
ncbi:TaqI-like C-terminal specificity domain-containing protein [Butyrivibrio sp. INlla14]|uniref:TaqI-like C-terminal specificity domain-containing protein n=1 Tax=Butyrivibrio sp. INlla14 TaxID=1520808 RepID=UPI0008774080|nr:TaqI-like C-terminal specificity domain-containing protein [Butyrivibrio sp. INlla14]SCY32103.1 DNA binding domain-containing protein, excisionase family [Butyrivibrio sp. INlla14]